MHVNERAHRTLFLTLFIAGHYRHSFNSASRLKAQGPAVRTEGTVLVKVAQKKGADAPFSMITDL